MDGERELITAFVSGARRGQVGRLYIQEDALYLDGWWHVAFRLAPDAFLIRDEPPPEPVSVVDDVVAELGSRQLQHIPGEHPLIQAVSYIELQLPGVEWTLWGVHAEHAEASLAYRAVPEEIPSDWVPGAVDDPALGDLSKEFAQSLVGGMPPSVILAVGLAPTVVDALRVELPDCRIEAHNLHDAIAACGRVVPHLALVDASTEGGRRFLLEFRAEACGRHVPVVAVTTGDVPLGADAVLDPGVPPAGWRDQLAQLLP